MATIKPRETTGRGLLFPLRRVHNDFENDTGEPLLSSCVRKVLNTRAFGFRGRSAGEYRWRYNFGSYLHLMRHSNQNIETAPGVRGDVAIVYVAEALLRWEPRVQPLTDRSEVTRRSDLPTARRLRVYYLPTNESGDARLATTPQWLEVAL